MSEAKPPPLSLYKQHSWSPDTNRDETWTRRRDNYRKQRRSKSVTDDDLEELKACIELGFGFDLLHLDRKLSDTLPALGFYHAVNKQYLDRSTSTSTTHSLSTTEISGSSSPIMGSPNNSIFDTGDNPKVVKARLKQWAQVVACSVRQSC
ncbi:hypothetical protein GIB67_010833 [Kingdonia uniflora]|uniref:Uncharacterized protein n=1 Tax=Kingdonia uniflora TaxID=39325 RepID=A0A7J7L8Y9_9MAGN|nr:hypothetical protein GIB67_010833 [Kingdonia uniflora]